MTAINFSHFYCHYVWYHLLSQLLRILGLFYFRYTHQQIEVFALMGQRSGAGNSPTERVLIDWGTKVRASPQNYCHTCLLLVLHYSLVTHIIYE